MTGPPERPTVLELLLDQVDACCATITGRLDRLDGIAGQLAPDRARSCRSAIALTRPMIDEIQDRAHARPLDEAGQ